MHHIIYSLHWWCSSASGWIYIYSAPCLESHTAVLKLPSIVTASVPFYHITSLRVPHCLPFPKEPLIPPSPVAGISPPVNPLLCSSWISPIPFFAGFYHSLFSLCDRYFYRLRCISYLISFFSVLFILIYYYFLIPLNQREDRRFYSCGTQIFFSCFSFLSLSTRFFF